MTRDELNTVFGIKKRIDSLKRMVDSLEGGIIQTSSINPLSENKGWKGSVVENTVIRIDGYKKKIKDLENEMYSASHILEDKIRAEKFDNPVYESLLILRYVDCLEYREIARIMNFSERHIYRLHIEK